jgi:hypothetical protein
MTKYLLGAAAAIALVATPAAACDGCNKKDVTAQADKKADTGCHCTKDGGKCKCGEKCTCDHCKMKAGEKKDDTKKT